jgi:hypothetical protein
MQITQMCPFLLVYVIAILLNRIVRPQDSIYFVERTYPQVILSEFLIFPSVFVTTIENVMRTQTGFH